MFTITVTETRQPKPGETTDPQQITLKVYEQSFEDLDLRAVVSAVNKRKRGPRSKTAKEKELL